MFELNIGKTEFDTKLFYVNLLQYHVDGGAVYTNKVKRIITGVYIDNNTSAPDIGTESVLKSIDCCDNLDKPIIIFDKIGDCEIDTFNKAIDLLKDIKKVKGMLPVPIESVAIIVRETKEEDRVLSKKADFINTWEAPNGRQFNIYRLW